MYRRNALRAALRTVTRTAHVPLGFVLALATLLPPLSGCDRSRAAAAPASTTAPALRATVSAQIPEGNQGQGRGYRYEISYPLLKPEWRALEPALQLFAERQKQEFFGGLADRQPRDPDWNLQLEFSVATQTQAFVSTFVNGSAYTGGAHPAPIIASFTEDVPGNALIDLADLFTDARAAYEVLSDEARRQLKAQFEAALRNQNMDAKTLAAQLQSMRAWVDRGTEPKPDNFGVFLVDGVGGKAIGLTLIFAPYQVAAYAEGTPQVEVPARVFYALLKPAYRDAFAMDPEVLKRLSL